MPRTQQAPPESTITQLLKKHTKRMLRAKRKPKKQFGEITRDPYIASEIPLEKDLHFLAESLPQIVWTAKPDGTVDYMNQRWFEYTGLTEEETYEETRSAVHPDDLALYKLRWKRALETQTYYETEYRFRHASDGAYRWHLGRALPVKDPQGNVLKWFGTCTDIQAQKEAEEQVRQLNEQLESIVLKRTKHLRKEIKERKHAEENNLENLALLKKMINTLPMAAVVANGHHTILHANDRFCSLHSSLADASMLIRKNCPHILEQSFQKLSLQQYEGFLQKLRRLPHQSFQYEASAKDDTTLSCEYIPIWKDDASGGYLLLIRDVSQEKRIDRAKSEFMSLASHQLRTPLTAIRWALGRLAKKLESRLDSEEEQLLLRARRSTMTMVDTITAMLAISRIEAGIHPISATPIPLATFLEEIRNTFQGAYETKKLSLTLACPDDLVLHTDRDMLREIFENLLSNAIKYTAPGGTILINAATENNGICLRVQDTGYGIPSCEHEKVFTKFYRGENIMQIDTEGTGLGLYLVMKLVKLLKGSIHFESEEEKGTEFVLQFPHQP